MIRSKDDWIAERAEELAQNEFDRAYFDLSFRSQCSLWRRAEDDWTNREIARAEALGDIYEERKLFEDQEVRNRNAD